MTEQTPTRINVPVTPETWAALDTVMAREDVSPAEAVRRLIEIGEHIYRASKVDRHTVLIDTPDGTREVVIP